MKAVQVNENQEFEVVSKDIPEPETGEVRIRVEACGVCHSDAMVKEGAFPGIQYPRIPGHEVIGIIEKIGAGVSPWTEGQRVGVGWHGGHCFTCEPCRRGDFINCKNAHITGISYDGGYAEYMVAPQSALAAVPEDLASIDAAPLLCAGVTTFNALRNSGVKPGEVVAVLGVGGLGHLAIQYANKMGCKTVALSRGTEKKALAQELGAHVYIDTESKKGSEELQKLGGAKVIMATAPNGKAMSELIDGLTPNGKLFTIAAGMEPVEVTPMQLIAGNKAVNGWASGTAMDSEDTLNFSSLTGITPKVEAFPLDKAEEAYQHMMSNKARFRAILKMV
ncbi:MAG TPA: alcohol dehydrogenase [Bacillales bacterium]|nr:alcohol dehydrogenase [Bacillales bacterium]